MTKPEDIMRGMMFRDSLPDGRGMLFFYGSPGKYQHWMYQVKVPLDIIWMDLDGRVVEVAADSPPCKSQASACSQYGGTRDAVVVLELPGGTATRHHVKVGDKILF